MWLGGGKNTFLICTCAMFSINFKRTWIIFFLKPEIVVILPYNRISTTKSFFFLFQMFVLKNSSFVAMVLVLPFDGNVKEKMIAETIQMKPHQSVMVRNLIIWTNFERMFFFVNKVFILIMRTVVHKLFF